MRKLVDRVYKAALPKFRTRLEQFKAEFPGLEPRTNWVTLRVEPILKHVKELEQRLNSKEFSNQASRLSGGVKQFHSDLVYLTENVKWLEEMIRKEKGSFERPVGRKRN